MSKRIIFLLLPMVMMMACGQTGPLYKPDAPSPIYVPKNAQ